MNFAELPKEKKQVVILAALSGFTVLFLCTNLVLKPAKEARAEAEKINTELAPKLLSADRVMKKDGQNQRNLRSACERILQVSRAHMPPDESEFAWALARIDDLGKQRGLFLRVDRQTRARYQILPPKVKYNEVRQSIPMFIPYTVKVSTQCSYEEVKGILTAIQEKFEYCSISRLSITTAENPEKHNVSFDVEWPIFRRLSDRAELEKTAGGKA